MGFLRQEYWSGLPFPSPGDLPDLGIEPTFLAFPALAGGFFRYCFSGVESVQEFPKMCVSVPFVAVLPPPTEPLYPPAFWHMAVSLNHHGQFSDFKDFHECFQNS